ncbi:hypothetical protein JYG23_11170 [Sedimentibacter sp. zth1]|uniref:M14 family metallopeptidase n=1 Tax=Sedimentibacter sp. zth1 TaxID=2816908 RepID=UPI001A91C0E0|nr:M14 family metallopeptidase [Sedimentibacter sp. zth1]QSX05235.1 hypothetical protein JYG23_11170 [Sedimentibacter sp. zth1]
MSLDNIKKILISKSMTKNQINIAINAALFMGFNSISSKFPIASLTEGIKINKSVEELFGLYNIDSKEPPKEFISSTKSAVKIPDFDWRPKKGLEALFGEGIFLKDNNFDLLPDSLNFKIKLPDNSNTSVVIAACNFAFRFGMETTAYEGSIIAEEDYNGNLIIFEDNGSCRITLEDNEQQKIVHVFGQNKELEEFSSLVCEKFPILNNSYDWVKVLQEMTESLSMKNLDGQLSYIKNLAEITNEKIQAFVSPEIQNKNIDIHNEFSNVEFYNYKDTKKIYEKEYDIPWEVDVLEDILNEEVYKKIKKNDKVEIYAAISEEKSIRNKVVEKIKENLKKQDVNCENIQLLCSYKQGISWIEEVVLPQLKHLSNVDKIKIAFKPFLPEGVTEWIDEGGATPSYNNIGTSDPNKWYDLPIRFLQELYPVDEIIQEHIHISKDNIEFCKYEDNKDITYLLAAIDKQGNEVYKDTYKVAYTQRPFLDEFPLMGKVHPSTGYLKVIVNGSCIVNKRIASDVENVWDIYQKNILTDCKNYIEKKINGSIKAQYQPFFSQLKLELCVSEPNYSLNSRQDLISTLDALHEDMYFVGTDFFKNYGNKVAGEAFDAPGLILPVIKNREGKPSFKVTLYDQLTDVPTICTSNEQIEELKNKEQISAVIDEITFENNKLNIHVQTDFENYGIVKNYAFLMDKQLLEICDKFTGINKIIFKTKNGTYEARIKEKEPQIKDISIQDIDILENTLIGYDQYIEIIEKLKRVPQLSVYKIANSYLGREIYAVELISKEEGYISRTKRITHYPSEIINCRHHANEVSSTNAAFMIIKELLINEKYKDVSNKINLVIVPMENVDGAAIHYELQKDNPNWKFHVARFNAIGKEFFSDHFKTNTIHKEAEGLRNIYRAFLPDLIVDNHGVPSHEWEQQFSGYTSPSFKGFWLPRSILYGYFWTVPNDEFKSNLILSKKIEDVVAVAIGNNEEMNSLNIEWSERFEKFAHKWMPNLFPANYYKNMINYWIPREFDLTQRYASHRFPWITTTYYTSEVADETAQGDYLNLCARAHLTHNLAIIDLMTKCKCIFDYSFKITNSSVSTSCTRQRPIIV